MAYTSQDLLTVLVAAVLTAGIYAAMSYGLSIIYGVMKIINLSNAGVMMLGAFTTFELFRRAHMDPFLASLIVFVFYFSLGLVMYRLLVRRVVTSPPISSLLLLFGVWLVIQNIAILIWGNQDESILSKYTFATVSVLGLPVSVTRLVVFFVSIVALGLVYFFLTHTYTGMAIRATAQNRDAARLVGIDVEKSFMIAFALGTALAAFAGSLLSTIYSFNPDFGRVFQLKSFSIIVLGGLESLPGVAIGAIILSFIESLSIFVMRASMQNFLAFTILVVALVVLPNGVAGLWQRGRG